MECNFQDYLKRMNFQLILLGHKSKPYTDFVLPYLWMLFVLDLLHEQTRLQNFLWKVALVLIHSQIQSPKN